MRRFNLDELLWFIIQLLLLIVMIYLKFTGKLMNFIGSKMIIYYNLSMLILIIYSIAQVSKIFTIRSRNTITNKFFPVTFVIILIVSFFYIKPNYRLLIGEMTVESDYMIGGSDNVINIDSNNYKIIQELKHDSEKYIGQVINFKGFVYNKSYLVNNEVIIAREVVSCCQSDKWMIEIRIEGVSNIEEGKWINIIGEISKDENGVYVEVEEYKEIIEPNDIYLHQQL